MTVDKQMLDVFDKCKVHIDAIAKYKETYNIDTTLFLTFLGNSVEMAVLNDISVNENEVMAISYTPPVEEKVSLEKRRVAK